jgi:hypothetical protein
LKRSNQNFSYSNFYLCTFSVSTLDIPKNTIFLAFFAVMTYDNLQLNFWLQNFTSGHLIPTSQKQIIDISIIQKLFNHLVKCCRNINFFNVFCISFKQKDDAANSYRPDKAITSLNNYCIPSNNFQVINP